MVKSFLNAFCGGMGRTLGKILIYLAIGLIFFFIYEDAHAAAVYGGTGSSCNSTKYNIFKQDGTRVTGTTSTSYNYNWKNINFYGTENLQANTYYDLVITFRSNISNSILNTYVDGSIIGNSGIDGIHLHSTSSLCGGLTGEIPLTYYSISGSKLTVRFLTGPTMIDYWWFSTNFYFNGSNGINTAVFTQVDLSGSSGIIENNNDNTNTIVNNNNQNTQDVIDNQNQNTQDVIDSQNQNAQDIQDTINNNFSSCQKNIFNASSYSSNSFDSISISNNVVNVSSDSTWKTVLYNFTVEPGSQYTIYYESFTDGALMYQNSDGSFVRVLKDTFTVITPTSSTLSVRLQNNKTGSFVFSNLFLSKGVVSKFSTYNEEVCSNKIDDVTGSINDLTGVISDSSDGDTNIFSTWWDNFDPVSNPLGSVVTLPITLAQKIVSFNSSSCQPINLGNLLGHNLILTCFTLSSVLPDNASSLINTIDIIMSISLLVVIIKNTYETIANLLSLGGENEVKKQFRLPTPLEFMANLLNGGGN